MSRKANPSSEAIDQALQELGPQVAGAVALSQLAELGRQNDELRRAREREQREYRGTIERLNADLASALEKNNVLRGFLMNAMTHSASIRLLAVFSRVSALLASILLAAAFFFLEQSEITTGFVLLATSTILLVMDIIFQFVLVGSAKKIPLHYELSAESDEDQRKRLRGILYSIAGEDGQ